MYDINDIWRTFKLSEKKHPSEWRNKVKKDLLATANMRAVKGKVPMTLATIEALYAYAMWCDTEFYMVVVQTFALVVDGKPEEASTVTLKIRKALTKRYAPDMELKRLF
jgi:hypothetical protein